MAGAGNSSVSEMMAKLAVSKSKNHRSAVVHNCAHDHELSHTLKTIDSIKEKASRSIEFEQRKFLQNLSLSTEDLRRGSQRKATTNKMFVNLGSSEDDLTKVNIKDHLIKGSSSSRTPSLTRLDLLRVQRQDLPRSFSDLDLRQISRGKSPSRLPVSSAKASSDKKKNVVTEDVFSSGQESEQTDPYSISSSMKISDSKGAFEICTGKSGLNAWMGKKVASPKVQRKVLY